ncbi:MAG: hypothetical protein GWO07_11005 [Candidatus Dadabacteria bacterium]|nr:hypothetical protein [Candidatus Dadabacteria bacterium]NIU88862.1 hypothetical protein [Nitrosopumilaceae archaeon]NIX15814.1 hypothetical protein [Candidatus Dadabacteria bacterium]
MIKKLSIVILFLLVIAAGTVHFWLHKDPPDAVIAAENALATEGLLMIAYFNNDLLTTILNYTRGEEDPSPMHMPVLDEGLWDDLYSGKVNLKENLDYIIVGASLPSDLTTIPSDHPANSSFQEGIIALGTFDRNSIQSAIRENYRVENEQENLYKITEIKQEPEKEKRVCPEDKSKETISNNESYIYATNNRLIASSSIENINKILNRLDNNAKADTDLTKWREFRKGTLGSTGFLLPYELIESSTGISKYLLQKEITDETALRKVFTGASVDYLKAGVKFDIHVQADNQDWLKEKSQNISKAVSEFKKESAEDYPTLQKLVSGFKISHSKDIMDISFAIDIDTLKRIPDLIGEFVGSLFSLGSASDGENESEERINENPWDYANNKGFEQMSDFTPEKNWPIPSITDGPFGIVIDSVSLGEKSNLLELDIKSQIRLPKKDEDNFMSWFGSGAELTLVIDSVKSEDGQELRRDEYCMEKLEDNFAKKNSEPESGFAYSNNTAYVSKTIRLITETSLKDIDKVIGKVSFTVPSKVKKIPVTLKKGTVVEHNDMRFYLSSIKQQSISYQISGDKDKLLEVRALNDKGQTLQSSFGSSSSYRNVKSFRGNVQGLEIYVLDNKTEFERNFELKAEDIFKVKYNEEKNTLPVLVEPGIVKKSRWKNLASKKISLATLNYYKMPITDRNKDIVAVHTHSPILITAEHKFNQKWYSQPMLQVYMPFIGELNKNLSALEVHITKPLNEKTKKEFTKFTEIRAPQSTKTGEYVTSYSHKDSPYMVDQIGIDLDLETGTKIETLEGKLTFRLPQKVTRTEVELSEIGKPMNINENIITVREINKGFIPRLKIDFEGNTEKLITIIAITDTGQRIFPAQTRLENNTWEIQYDLGPAFTHFEVVMADEQTVIEYPFSLKPEYSQEQN